MADERPANLRREAHRIANEWASRFGDKDRGPPPTDWIQRAASLAYEGLFWTYAEEESDG